MNNLINCGGRYYEVPSNEPEFDGIICDGDGESDQPDYDQTTIQFEEIIWTEF